MGHEFTHAVNADVNQLVYSYESGAIDEGLADLFGEFSMGDGSFIHREDLDPSLGVGTRDLMGGAGRPTVYDPIEISSTSDNNDNGGVHTVSSLVSRAVLRWAGRRRTRARGPGSR